MKVVFYTQFSENYGAHSWDGNGDCPQYWKAKGGDTYVIPNITVSDAINFKETYLPIIAARIETNNNWSCETIVDWAILDDDAVVCEDWEEPVVLSLAA